MDQVTRKIYLRAFRAYLGDTNVVNRYCMACAMQGRTMSRIVEKYDPVLWVSYAFNFHQSFEGHEFWDIIDQGWLEVVQVIERELKL